jgi:cardiolipin synthase A/B
MATPCPADGLSGGDGTPVSVRTAQHELTLYPDPGPLFEAFERLIAPAARRVWLETYIYRDDALGAPFSELLIAAARRGLDVRLLYDPQGSRGARRRFFADLATSGVSVRAYRPWRLAPKRWTYWPRDHGRIIVIDDTAHTGGINWGREWLPRSQGGEQWHDVSLGIRGPTVNDFATVFLRRWAESTELDSVADHVGRDAAADVQFIADSPADTSIILQHFCAAIRHARNRVWMENSYCVPPKALLVALSDAAERGVDVQLITAGQSDLPIVQAVTRGEYLRWLRNGLRVFEYQPRVLHSKFALVDESWATVGTFNAMSPGVWWANETNVIVRDAGFVSELARVFRVDLAQSRCVTRATCAARPIGTRLWESCVARAYRAVELLVLGLQGRARSRGQ